MSKDRSQFIDLYAFQILSDYYESLGVTFDQAKRALRIRLETLEYDIGDTIWDINYGEAIEKEFIEDVRPQNVNWQVLGDDAYDRLRNYLIETIRLT